MNDEPSTITPSTREQRRQPWYALQTEVRPSTKPGAGLGLFMVEKAVLGDRVAVYGGDVMDAEQAAQCDSDYIVRIHVNQYLGGERIIPHHFGRYVNYGGAGTDDTNNALLGYGYRGSHTGTMM